MAGRTTLVITHKHKGLDSMDMLYVIDQGRIVEQGTPGALRATKRSYYHHMSPAAVKDA